MAIITFKPKQVTKRLTSVLADRPRFVIMNRFGIGDNSERMTLEAIGSTYNITRERVRQIENFGLNFSHQCLCHKSPYSPSMTFVNCISLAV
jgi:hypothetical protein